MSGPKKREIIRPCSQSEISYTYLHYRGWYRSVGFQGRFSPPPARETLLRAIAHIALSQPMLRYGIADESERQPYFVRVRELALDRIVIFDDDDDDEDDDDDDDDDSVRDASMDEYEERLLGEMLRSQDALFDDMENVVPWRVHVRRPSGLPGQADFCDVVFIFHHAVGDGMTGKVFMESLRDLLNDPPSDSPALPSDNVIPLPTPPPVFPDVLRLIPFGTTLPWLFREVWNLKMPAFLRLGPREAPTWSITDPDANRSHATHARMVRLPARVGDDLAAACRERGVTVTPLLHALLVAAAARRAPSEGTSWRWKDNEVFRGRVTVNLRPWIDRKMCPEGAEARRLVVCAIGEYTADTTPAELEAFRNAATPSVPPRNVDVGEPPPTLDSLIWKSAQTAAAAQRAKQASLPLNDGASLMPYRGDMRVELQNRMLPGTPRNATSEVGNLGTVDPYGAVGRDAARHRLSRVVFANPAMPMMSPLMLNVASVKGGEMTMLMTFGDGEVEAGYVDAIMADMERWMRGWKERGLFV